MENKTSKSSCDNETKSKVSTLVEKLKGKEYKIEKNMKDLEFYETYFETCIDIKRIYYVIHALNTCRYCMKNMLKSKDLFTLSMSERENISKECCKIEEAEKELENLHKKIYNVNERLEYKEENGKDLVDYNKIKEEINKKEEYLKEKIEYIKKTYKRLKTKVD